MVDELEDDNPEEQKHYLIRCGIDECNYVALTRPDLLEHKRVMHS